MAKKVLMIPFKYYTEEMLDWYDFIYEEGTENTREIVWDTEELRSVWFPNIRSYKYPNETDESFEAAKIIDKKKQDEYFERLQKGRYIKVDEVIWKPNFEFITTLKYDCYSRGRSSAKIHFTSIDTEHHYEMFLTDFDDLMKSIGFKKNTVYGVWTFVKRGQNYGIKFVREPDRYGK